MSSALSSQEIEWLRALRLRRATDQHEVQIYPMGAERYLASVLFGQKKRPYNLRADIKGQRMLLIPGFGPTGFLLAKAGAASVHVVDKDPVTLAWLKAFKRFYHYREQAHSPSIAELMDALMAWYPPLISLPKGRIFNRICWVVQPQWLRRRYIFNMLHLVQHALAAKVKDQYALQAPITFQVGTVDELLKSGQSYDTAFVPYLLGVKNGIESVEEIVGFMEKLLKIVPAGSVLVNPSRNSKEFYLLGKRYFVSMPYPLIQSIPGLQPYFFAEDRTWFATQGLAVFRNQMG